MPAPHGTVFVIGGGVFAVGLVGEDGMVGDGVCAGARDLAEEETLEAESAGTLELAFLLVVDVDEVELTGTARETCRGVTQEAAHNRRTKGIEEENETRAGGKT